MSSEFLRRPLHYDAARRRLWIYGQRCHHGATGALLAGAAGVAVTVAGRRAPSLISLVATGSLLMAHDWKDRTLWFRRGWQDQP
jgi:hypothetical protein